MRRGLSNKASRTLAVRTRAIEERIPFRVHPMLATLVPEPFHRKGWVYEEKYDGDRILAYKEGERTRLLSRNDIDRTLAFAEIAAAIGNLSVRTLLLDGEVVALDDKGVSRFQLLQRGMAQPRYAVFDCLYKDGVDLRREPLSARRAVLESVLGRYDGRLFPSQRLADNGLVAFKVATEQGYEGLVAKDLSSTYVEGRSTKWLKVKVRQEEEFVIAGYTEPSGSRKYFGALLLGGYYNGKLYYVGKVGTGFSEQNLASLYRAFQPLLRKNSALVDPPREKGLTFLEPRLVAQIAFHERTADGKLRQPVFLGLRFDKNAHDCVLPAEPPCRASAGSNR